MLKHSYKFLLVVFALLIGSNIKIQAQSQVFEKAEKLYKAGDYYSAIAYYSDYLSGKASNIKINSFTGYLSKPNAVKSDIVENPKTQAAFHLAESYRQTNDYTNAESWYDSATHFKGADKFPSIGYWYGVSLRANGKAPAAKAAFMKYISTHDEKATYYQAAKKELADLDFAANQLAKKQRRKIIFQRMNEPANSKESNYAPFAANQQFYFSSTREDTNVVSKTNPYQHHIYTASFNGKGVSNPTKLSFQQDKNIQQGAASFSADGKTVFLTQWVGKTNKVGAIFMSTKTDSSWTVPVMLDSTINVKGYNSQQPYLSTDGKYLFFASDRPGGLGKYDIWCAELNARFETQSVVNLDNTVNTREDEKAPYFNVKNQTLVFASNGRVGMGGYDLYYSKKDNTSFNEAINFGTPTNSSKDDIYFFSKDNTDDLLGEAWISSDRISTCCLELYSIQRLPPPINHIVGTVKNTATKQIVPNANLEWNNNGKQVTIKANDRGDFELVVPDNANYKVTVYNPKYYDTTVSVNHQFETVSDSIFSTDIYLRPIPEVEKTIDSATSIIDYMVYFDFALYNLTDSAKDVLNTVVAELTAHPNWKMALEGYTDNKGDNDYNLKLSKNRTDTCFKYLIQHQIDANRLVPAFFGEAKPVAPNTTNDGKDYPEGRKLNRRVKISVLKQVEDTKMKN